MSVTNSADAEGAYGSFGQTQPCYIRAIERFNQTLGDFSQEPEITAENVAKVVETALAIPLFRADNRILTAIWLFSNYTVRAGNLAAQAEKRFQGYATSQTAAPELDADRKTYLDANKAYLEADDNYSRLQTTYTAFHGRVLNLFYPASQPNNESPAQRSSRTTIFYGLVQSHVKRIGITNANK